jgi:hypothetical protein
MGQNRQAVLLRRQVLLAKIADQRVELNDLAIRWQPVLGVADNSLNILNIIRSNVVVVAAVAGFLVMRGSGLTGLLRSASRVWKTYRYVNEFSKKITSRL